MHRLLICMVMVLAIVIGSIIYIVNKPKLDTETILSIFNTIMEFYYAEHHGNFDKLQTMFYKEMSTDKIKNVIGSGSAYIEATKKSRVIKRLNEEKMEFIELYIGSKKPLLVEIVVRVWSKKDISPPPYSDDLIVLKKIEGQWKIIEFTVPGL